MTYEYGDGVPPALGAEHRAAAPRAPRSRSYPVTERLAHMQARERFWKIQERQHAHGRELEREARAEREVSAPPPRGSHRPAQVDDAALGGPPMIPLDDDTLGVQLAKCQRDREEAGGYLKTSARVYGERSPDYAAWEAKITRYLLMLGELEYRFKMADLARRQVQLDLRALGEEQA